MDPDGLHAALAGRIAPEVMDAYLGRLAVREAVPLTRLAFLPSAEGAVAAAPAMPANTRYVALPLRGKKGWSLAVADTSSGVVTLLARNQRASADGDGGLEVLGWAEALAVADGEMPCSPGDDLMVRLNLTVMFHVVRSKPSAGAAWVPHVAAQQPVTAIVRADLAAPVRLSDDTIDACTAMLQRRAGVGGRIRIMRCAEVKAWAAARAVVDHEPAGQREALEAEYRRTVEACLAEAACVVMPLHHAGHWLLVVINQLSDAFYALDSMGRSGMEAPLVDACRWLAPSRCGSMRYVSVDVPHQQDGVSCGIYALCFAEALIDRAGDDLAAWGQAPPCWRHMKVDAGDSRRRFAHALANLP